MTTDTLTELSQVSFFEEFLPRHMEKLTSLGSEVHFNKDEIIFRENQDSKVFYVILSGRIALEANVAGQTYVGKFKRGSSEIIVAIMGSRTMWADLKALVEYGFSEQASTVATENMKKTRIVASIPVASHQE